MIMKHLCYTMSTDPNGVTKLTTNFSLAKLQGVSAWNAQAVEQAPHSAGAKSAASSTRGASDRTIDRAEPCFITNTSVYTHQQAHWINTIRGSNADTMALVASSKSLLILCPNVILSCRKLSFAHRVLLTTYLACMMHVIWPTVSSFGWSPCIFCLTHYFNSRCVASHHSGQICNVCYNLLT